MTWNYDLVRYWPADKTRSKDFPIQLENPKNIKVKLTTWWTVKIDPRGHFTMLRCATIIVFDKILKVAPLLEKPLVEFCIFLGCHPTF